MRCTAEHRPRALVGAGLAALLLVAGCSRDAGPRVEVREGGAYHRRAVESFAFAGHRDGAVTRATATFALEGGEHLHLELDIDYDPTPALGGGRWRVDGRRAGQGSVRAESVKFFGGQGQGPSVGGRFLLQQDGTPRFRVTLPARPVNRRSWNG